MLFDVNFHLETKKEAQIMKYSISIPKPCHENWNNMTPTEKGAFCSSCQKEVIDFTSKSNRELAKTLRKKEPLCGKFRPEQLNVELVYREDSRASKFGFLLGLSGLLSFSMPVFAQTLPVETNQEQTDTSSEKEQVVDEVINDTSTIRGQVLDENGETLPMVNVVIKNLNEDGTFEIIRGTTSDFDGHYVLMYEVNKVNREFFVEFSFLGYENRIKKVINKPLRSVELNITLDSSFERLEVVGGLMYHKKRTIFTKIGNIFRKKENRR